MKKRTKTWVRILAVFLAVLLLGSTVYMILDFLLQPVNATSLDELNQQQEEIDEQKKELKAKQQELAAQRADLQNTINELKEDISAIQLQKEAGMKSASPSAQNNTISARNYTNA